PVGPGRHSRRTCRMERGYLVEQPSENNMCRLITGSGRDTCVKERNERELPKADFDTDRLAHLRRDELQCHGGGPLLHRKADVRFHGRFHCLPGTILSANGDWFNHYCRAYLLDSKTAGEVVAFMRRSELGDDRQHVTDVGGPGMYGYIECQRTSLRHND